MDNGKVFLGVLGGVAAGALLGILFAPEKGAVTRRKIARTGEDYLEEIKDKFNEMLEGASDKFEAIKDKVSK
jgi:gas vesicle protein